MRLNWNKLITTKRYKGKTYNLDTDIRNEFEKDYDRIIYSTPFRRMKDKTQVFPIPKSDFIHNRLTHSLEAASTSRSLGKLCGRFILRRENEISDANRILRNVDENIFGQIVATACLAHDIGNPPFGHSGENSFRLYFEKLFGNSYKKNLFETLTEKQKMDFLRYEGNAEGFRILTNAHPSGNEGGLRLTYTTLAAFSKYTAESSVNSLNERGKQVEKRRSNKKFGFFQSEKYIFEDIANELGLIRLSDDEFYWCRHPLAYLVEAADNISYTLMDIEDAHKLGLISEGEVNELLGPIADSIPGDPCPHTEFKRIKNLDERIGAYRAKALSALIFHCYNAFAKNYEEIMHGRFDQELTDVLEDSVLENLIKVNTHNRKFFSNDKVIQIEFAGNHVIKGLLDIYLECYENKDKQYAKNLLGKLPAQFDVLATEDRYQVILRISNFISRMTDSYAFDHFKKLTGISYPEIS